MKYVHDVTLSDIEVKNILLQCDEKFVPPRWTDERLMEHSKKLNDFACKDLVVENNTVIGCNMYYVNKDTHIAFISIIAVNKQYRGQSIGSLMLDKMKENLDDSISTIRLQVSMDNIGAQKFYKKHGFVEIETGESKNMMELKI